MNTRRLQTHLVSRWIDDDQTHVGAAIEKLTPTTSFEGDKSFINP